MDELMELYGDRDNHGEVGGSDQVLLALGGPIFVPGLVSPLTRVADFENAVFRELEELKVELMNSGLPFIDDNDNEDISVDELKVFSEEELVAEAMKEAFKDKDVKKVAEDHSNNQYASPSLPENPFGAREGNADEMIIPALKYYSRRRRRRHGTVTCEASNSLPSGAIVVSASSYNGQLENAKSNKKKKREMTYQETNDHDQGYLAKARELAKIRQKQEDDKAMAELHSLKAHRGKSERKVAAVKDAERQRSHDWLNYTRKVKLSNTSDYKGVNYPEVILCVEVYHNKKYWQKTQEIMVLGEQTLTELKDKINCLTDVIMEKAGVYDPSGYFMIEESFYNDLRDPFAIDYSEPILDWARNSEDAPKKWQSIMSGLKKNQKNILGDEPISRPPKFKAFNMQETRFRELEFQIGTCYLYCHQGECKHRIVFRDVRLIHPEDVQNQAAYPIAAYTNKIRLLKCSVCEIYKATKFTLNDRLADRNPCYFCEDCYHLLHYSANNTLLYDDFTVYDYLQ